MHIYEPVLHKCHKHFSLSKECAMKCHLVQNNFRVSCVFEIKDANLQIRVVNLTNGATASIKIQSRAEKNCPSVTEP